MRLVGSRRNTGSLVVKIQPCIHYLNKCRVKAFFPQISFLVLESSSYFYFLLKAKEERNGIIGKLLFRATLSQEEGKGEHAQLVEFGKIKVFKCSCRHNDGHPSSSAGMWYLNSIHCHFPYLRVTAQHYFNFTQIVNQNTTTPYPVATFSPFHLKVSPILSTK